MSRDYSDRRTTMASGGFWEGLKNVPLLGKIFRITEILAKITKKLIQIQGEVIELQGKTSGDVALAIGAALVSVGCAIAAVAAATGDPEPITKTALALAAASAIISAIVAIKAVFNAVESCDKSRELRGEMGTLRKFHDELEEELAKLKREL